MRKRQSAIWVRRVRAEAFDKQQVVGEAVGQEAVGQEAVGQAVEERRRRRPATSSFPNIRPCMRICFHIPRLLCLMLLL